MIILWGIIDSITSHASLVDLPWYHSAVYKYMQIYCISAQFLFFCCFQAVFKRHNTFLSKLFSFTIYALMHYQIISFLTNHTYHLISFNKCESRILNGFFSSTYIFTSCFIMLYDGLCFNHRLKYRTNEISVVYQPASLHNVPCLCF